MGDDVYKNTPIEEIPDCPEKLVKIIKHYKETGQKYEDRDFEPSDSLLNKVAIDFGASVINILT